ncbi:MAG: AAA family ATPase [Acidobacteria bacterium]|nr:AAA family ATPase [Acidobacteriota bacterium]
MHEDYYGFSEKPFNLTPDPKYLYKSQSHAGAFELLQYAIRRREGFVVVTGDIGTGKTTLCRAVLENLDRKTFAALILNPFLSEEDLLRAILQDFGVVSREEIKRGRLHGVSKLELIETLNEFLLSLLPLGAGALLIIDEAQNLPLQVLEQIRILSNLETDKEKLLQIVLVGQQNLRELLRSPELRQLDQRISIRFELEPLDPEETAAYVAHRLAIAGGGAVRFAPSALELVHRSTSGIPRLINLLCDRALLGGYSARTARITPEIVASAAAALEFDAPRSNMAGWFDRHAAGFAAGAAVMALLAAGTYAAVQLQDGRASAEQLPGAPAIHDTASPPGSVAAGQGNEVGDAAAEPGEPPEAASDAPQAPGGEPTAVAGSTEELAGRFSVVVGSFRVAAEAEQLTGELQARGFSVRTRRVESAGRGAWHQVFIGPYTDYQQARTDEARVRQIPGYGDARLISH